MVRGGKAAVGGVLGVVVLFTTIIFYNYDSFSSSRLHNQVSNCGGQVRTLGTGTRALNGRLTSLDCLAGNGIVAAISRSTSKGCIIACGSGGSIRRAIILTAVSSVISIPVVNIGLSRGNICC